MTRILFFIARRIYALCGLQPPATDETCSTEPLRVETERLMQYTDSVGVTKVLDSGPVRFSGYRHMEGLICGRGDVSSLTSPSPAGTLR